MIAERMEAMGWETSNCSICGQDTADILLRLEKDVIAREPDVCFVGLGVANEGLSRAHGTEREVVCGVFERNLLKIVKALRAAGIYPVLGGVYPNNDYDADQHTALKCTAEHMHDWDVPVIEWLPVLTDENGHFRAGLFADGWHPNDAGYNLMAQQVTDEFLRSLPEKKSV